MPVLVLGGLAALGLAVAAIHTLIGLPVLVAILIVLVVVCAVVLFVL